MSREVRRDLANTRRCIGEMYRDGLGTARNKTASARRKRAAGHLRQVEKKHSHDPHPGVTGQLEYDHPVSYAVAVAKKPAEAEPEQNAAEAAASAAPRLRGGRA